MLKLICKYNYISMIKEKIISNQGYIDYNI